MLLSYYFIIFDKNIYTMEEIKYIPTNYSYNRNITITPWSINPETYEFFGYQPRLRNRITQEIKDESIEKPVEESSQRVENIPIQNTRNKSTQQTKKEPVQETVQAKPVSEQQIHTQEAVESENGKIYTNQRDFVEDMTAAYTKALAARGISTDYAKMLVAQDALESNWGKSSLAKDFNFGGIKAVKGTPFVEKETKEYSAGKGMHKTKSKFRKFNSLNDYVNYKIDLLSGKRYQAFTGDPTQFYHRIKAGGYATDPNYVAKLTNIYNNSILSAKQGGNIPSRIDALVEKFNKQFNK